MPDLGTIEGKVAIKGLGDAKQQISDLDRTLDAFAGTAEKRFKRVKVSSEDVAKAMGLTGDAFKKFQDDALRAFTTVQASRGLETLARNCGYAKERVQELGRQMGLAENSIKSLTDKLYGVNKEASSGLLGGKGFGDILKNTFAYGSAYQLLGYIQQVPGALARAVAELDTLRQSFNGVFGDSAATQFQYAIDVSNKYGKSISSVADSYKKFAAATDYVGMATADSQKIFESVTKAITKIGGTSDDVSGSLLALQQMISKGTVSSEEFRLQFAERIPGAMKMGADAVGVTTAQFKRMMENGEIVASDFLPKLASQLEEFSKGWENAAGSIQSNWERIKNSGFITIVNFTETLLTTSDIKILEKRVAQAVEVINNGLKKIKPNEDEKGWLTQVFQGALYGTSGSNIATVDIGGYSARNDRAQAKIDAINQYYEPWKQAAQKTASEIATILSRPADISPESGKRVEELQEKLAAALKTIHDLCDKDWSVSFAANIDTEKLNKAASVIDKLYRNSAEGKISDAQKQIELIGFGQKAYQEELAQIDKKLSQASGSSPITNRLLRERKNIEEILQQSVGAYEQAEKDLNEKSKHLQNEMLRKANPFYGTGPGDFLDLGMKSQSRMAAYQKDLIDKNYWVDIYSPNDKVRSIAQERQKTLYQKYLDGVQKDNEEALRKQSQKEKYEERARDYLEQAQDQYAQAQAQYSGDTLASKEASIERRYGKAAAAIRRFMDDAKGSTKDAQAALDVMGKSKALEILQAQADAWKKSMRDAASLMQELGNLSGDPQMLYGASMTSAQAWEAEQKKRINAIEDISERTKQLSELQSAMALKEVDARSRAYEGMKSVSSKYWEAEKDLLQQHLATVKKNADDETAYKIYAAQQWDEYNKKALENQAQYGGSFSDVFAAKWSLAFGSYRNDLSKAHKDWESFSDDVIDLAQGMGDAIAGSWGDAIRSILSGKGDISDLGKNMVSRMVDSVAGFVEKSMKRSWNDMLGQLFGGSASDLAQTQAVTAQAASVTANSVDMSISSATINVSSASVNGASGRDTLSGSSDMDRLDDFGKTAGTSFADTLKQQTANDGGFVFGTSQGLETLVGKSGSNTNFSAINALAGLHLEKLDPTLATQLGKAAKEFKEVTGRNLTLTSGFRTYAQQAQLFAEKGAKWAAEPGKSMHNFGQSVDVASKDLKEFSKIASKYGLKSLQEAGLKNEPWHYQLSDSFSRQAVSAIRNGTFVSQYASTDPTQEIKQFSVQAGKTMGQSFWDRYSEEAIQNNHFYPKASFPVFPYVGGISNRQSEVASFFASRNYEDSFKSFDSSGIQWGKLGGVVGGASQIAMGAASGNIGSMIGGGISTAGSLLGTFGTTLGITAATSALLGTVLPLVGTAISVVAGLLQHSEKTEKTGSGYNVAINAGQVQLAGVDFYRTTTTSGYSTSTSHTARGSGVIDPDVGRDITKYLKDSAKNLKEFGKELGISVAALKDFSAPMQTITKDAISIYERNMSNLQAQVVVTAEGLRGAFDYVAENQYEIYVDEFKRLAMALKTVGGYTEAYGYDLYTMAGITDDAIAAIREYNEESFQIAQDTLPAVWAAVGATSDQIENLTSTLQEQADTAAKITDEQYAKLLEADYASQLEDAVGGEDAFKQVMENLIGNILDDLEAYEAQAAYYVKKSNSAIADLGVDGVTIENFWDSFSTALTSYISPEDFELWSDASTWVNNLNTMNDAIDAWNENILKVTATLQAREQSSTGSSRQAEITSLLSSQEQELYEARKNNFDQATFDYILEVQRLELAKKYEDLDQEEYQKQQDFLARIASANDLTQQTTLIQKYASAEQELYEARAEGYSEATIALLEAAQAAELAATLADNLKDVQNEIQSLRSRWSDLTAREYAANDDDVMSGYTALQSQQAAELLQAYQDGMSQEYIDALKQTQIDELAAKWKDLNLSKLHDDLSDIKDDLDDIVTTFQDAMDSISSVIDAELSHVKALVASADAANSSLASTVKDLTTGTDSPLNASQKAAGLYYQIATAYGTMLSKNVSTAATSGGLDTTGLSSSQTALSLSGLISTASSTMYSASGAAKISAAQTISDLAGDYVSALQSSLGNSEEFYDKYIDVLTVLKEAQSITGAEKSYEQAIADALTAEQTILGDILEEIRKGSDASTTKIQALLEASQTISSSMSGLYDDTVNNETSWRSSVTNLLKEAGYSDADITAALGGPTSTSSFLAQLADFNQTTMPSYIQSILDLLTKLINIQGQIDTETPIAPQPNPGSSYTQDEINWATNVRSAMNYQSYGGSSAWTIDQVLANLATYASWASAYGVSASNAFTAATAGSQYYYEQQASLYNAANKTTKTWLDMSTAVGNSFGSQNYLAHWLNSGYKEGISFPTDDQVMYKTAQYYLNKWRADGGVSSGYSSPLSEAQYIEQSMMGSTSWTASALEAAAKAHYDAYGKAEGLIKPYALGGLIDSPLALVGEVGPEIIASPGATVTPASVTQNILGEAFADLTAEVKQLRKELYGLMRNVSENTRKTNRTLDEWNAVGMPASQA